MLTLLLVLSLFTWELVLSPFGICHLSTQHLLSLLADLPSRCEVSYYPNLPDHTVMVIEIGLWVSLELFSDLLTVKLARIVVVWSAISLFTGLTVRLFVSSHKFHRQSPPRSRFFSPGYMVYNCCIYNYETFLFYFETHLILGYCNFMGT